LTVHEHGVINDLMRRITGAAAAEKAERIVSVSVWLGAFSHMSPDHFREHFDQASAGTLAEGARLDITASDDIHDSAATDVLITGIEVESEC
jgi:hydrogenase nickel incorporation protein HypA/HybF